MPRSPDDRKRRASEPLADSEILRRLAAEQFDILGPTWRHLSEVLVEYGYSVFVARLMSGTVRRMAAAQRRNDGRKGVLGLSRLPRDLKLTRDDAHELTAELLQVSIRRFLDTLSQDRWQPTGGASLRTFFIGRCLMDLPDVYERWQRQQQRWAAASVELTDLNDRRVSVDPADAALDALELDALLPENDPARVMLRLASDGYTYAQIADIFEQSDIPCTEAMVRTRIMRARARARQKRRGDTDGR